MRDCDVTCQEASRVPNRNGFFHSLTNFHKKIHEAAKHSRRVPRLYGCGRFWGCTSLRQKKTPRFEPRGDVDTHAFPGLSPEILVSRRDYSHRYRVSTVFESHPLRLSVLSERE